MIRRLTLLKSFFNLIRNCSIFHLNERLKTMAQKAVQEYYSKKLLIPIFRRELGDKFVQDESQLWLVEKLDDSKKIPNGVFAVKPDVCIGKKGKNNLLLLDADANKAREFLKQNFNKTVEISGVKGVLDTFLVEPYVDNDNEHFAAVMAKRDCDELLYSPEGGVDVEENWEKIKTIKIGLFEQPDEKKIAKELGVKDPLVAKFLAVCVTAAREIGSPYLEFNPFTIKGGKIYILGTVLRLDSYEEFAKRKLWSGIVFREPFGVDKSEHEKRVGILDDSTSGSLKLTVFNKNAPLWLLVAGGGASVIYADTSADIGLAEKLGNYGEYSGNPTEEETFEYSNILFELVEQSNAPKKAVVIGGAIANFTDVAATLKGVCRAIEKHAGALKKANVAIFVRRGGPNYKAGLAELKKTCEKAALHITMFGPEKPMTEVIPLAKEWIK